jgi:hypothetical protein
MEGATMSSSAPPPPPPPPSPVLPLAATAFSPEATFTFGNEGAKGRDGIDDMFVFVLVPWYVPVCWESVVCKGVGGRKRIDYIRFRG